MSGDSDSAPSAYVVMGICGCGKSTVAQSFGQALGAPVLDADDFHSPSNVEKMSQGIPLTDQDRAGWLERLNRELRDHQARGESVVLACSALKQRYRDRLEHGLRRCHWIYLKGSREIILERMAARQNHFMPVTLVDSQLADLEEPKEAEVVDIALPLDRIQAQLLKRFASGRSLEASGSQ